MSIVAIRGGVQADTDPVTGEVRNLQVGGSSVDLNVSAQLAFCIPGRDVSTRFNDLTSNAANLAVEGGNTGAFGTEKYFSTTAAVNGGLNVPQAKIQWNPYTESMILAFVMKRAVPGVNEAILTVSSLTAGNQGFYLSHRSGAGKLKIVGVKNDGALVAQADSTLAFSDGTPQDRHVLVAYDAPTGSFYLYRDGVLSDSYVGAHTPGGADSFVNAVSNAFLRVGFSDCLATVAGVALQGYGLQFAKAAEALPVNIGQIAARLAETPRIPLRFGEW